MHISSLNTTIIKHLYLLEWNALDWLFPPECVKCGEPGTNWCDSCQKKIEIIQKVVCPICGIPSKTNAVCPQCKQHPPTLDWLRSWAIYNETLKTFIHALKYKNNRRLATTFANAIAEIYKNNPYPVDFITVVPLSKKRTRQRGYNQVALIAKALQPQINLKFHPEAICRIRNTETQVGKNFHERAINVIGAFRANPMLVQDKSILILDDVYTTGATLNACTNALKNAGASRIIGITAARAGLYQHQSESAPVNHF